MVEPYPIPLKNMKVSWDYDIPSTYGKIKNVPNHQPAFSMDTNLYIASQSSEFFCETFQHHMGHGIHPHDIQQNHPSVCFIDEGRNVDIGFM